MRMLNSYPIPLFVTSIVRSLIICLDIDVIKGWSRAYSTLHEHAVSFFGSNYLFYM